jgi:tRNA pseudouridine38-40 synthase
MARFKLTIEYDGTGFCGWQKQNDAVSVQGFLLSAAQKLAGTACDVVGAGRTDAGVHATAQVAHVDIAREINPYNVMHALNYHLLPLTSQVTVLKAETVGDDFHARFSATGRSYCYRIVNRQARLAIDLNRAWHIPEPLDAQAMHEAAQSLLGHHDFTTFRSSICQSKSPLKTLDRLDVVRDGDEIRIYAESRSFLHHQVRNMAGTLRFIGNRKWTASDLLAALDAKDRKRGGETAAPQGLYLTEVRYGN